MEENYRTNQKRSSKVFQRQQSNVVPNTGPAAAHSSSKKVSSINVRSS
jgi:hypothetical protein